MTHWSFLIGELLGANLFQKLILITLGTMSNHTTDLFKKYICTYPITADFSNIII